MEKGIGQYNGGDKGKAQSEDGKGVESELRRCTDLGMQWSIWEQWQPQKRGTGDDYLKNMQIVAKFDNLIEFCQLWNCLPHATPSKYFACREGLKTGPSKEYDCV